MAQRILTKGFGTTIPVSILEKDANGVTKSKDVSTRTDTKACIQALNLTIGGGGIVITSDPRGEFNVVLTAANVDSLTNGNDQIVGQVEFGTTANPIKFSIPVRIEDENCA